MKVLLTGATGFIGKSVLKQLCNDHSVAVAVRSSKIGFRCPVYNVGEIDGWNDWSFALHGQEVAIHLAGRAHIQKDEVADPITEYRRTNVDGTLNLARQAADAGIKRFIFISSIKVNGERNSLDAPFLAQDIPAPEDAYGQSKWEAEMGLLNIGSATGMEIVIIRPPLVYGFGVKGNFASLIKIVQKGLPLPLGLINNKRSLVALDNLVDLIVTCITHPAAANQVFLAGDDDDLSTTKLLRGVAKAAGVPSRLIPVPASVLMFVASLLGKKTLAQKLLGSLQVDISKTRDLLGWTPPLSVEEGLRRCFVEN